MLVVALAVVVRQALDPLLGGGTVFITFFPAVAIAAWLGGLGAGITAVVLSELAVGYFFLEPRGTLTLANPESIVGLIVFGFAALLIAGLSQSLRTAERRASESAREVARQKEWLEVTLSSIGDGVIATDMDGRVMFLNPVAEPLTGWTSAEAAGKPLEEVFRILNEQTRRPVESPVSKVLREGTIVGLANHTVLIARDGLERPIDDSAAPIRDEDGRTIGVVLVFRDATEKRRNEEVRNRLAAIVESSEDAILAKTLDGIITSWNRAAERLYGYSPSEVVGKPVSLLMPEDVRDDLRLIMERVRRGEPTEHFETIRRRKDGTLIDVSVSVSPIRAEEGTVIGASTVARDITARKRADERIRKSEQELADLFENAAVGIHWVGPDGTILRVNRAELEMLGYTAEEYVGRHVADFHVDRDVIDDILQRLDAGETIRERPARLRRKDGSIRHVVIDSNVLWEDGAFVHTRCFTRDVTLQTRFEEDLRLLVDASAALTDLADPRSTLRHVARLTVPPFADWCAIDVRSSEGNLEPVAFAHADRTKAEPARELRRSADGDSRHEVLRTGRSELVEDVSDAALAETSRDPDHLRRLRDSGIRSYICVPLRARDDVLGTFTFASTTSGRRYGAGDLAFAEELARRAAIALENARLYQEVRETDRRKNEFLAMLAHELRNPLAPVRSGLDVLARTGAEDKVVEPMRRQVEHLVRLVDDLLDVSRIMRGRIELRRQPIELKTVVDSALDLARPLIDSQRHELCVSLPPETVWLDADPVRLAQVVANLLNNAAKYTPRGGRIDLEVTRGAGHVSISVRDNGVGIEPALLPEVFDLFVQAEKSIDRTHGGLGIGLTLVKSLVELHGGSVSASSEGPGRGSEFSVRLPALEREPTGRTVTETAPAALPRRVLIVDDNADAAVMLQLLLETLGGHEVTVAHDGEGALEEADRGRYEVILVDIGLPRMSGYEVARQLRERNRGQRLLLVAITGFGTDDDRRRALESGFDEHVVKPPSAEALERLLRHPKLRS